MALTRASTNCSLSEDESTVKLQVRPDIAQIGPTSKKYPVKLGIVAGIFLSMASPSCTTPAPWLMDRLRDSSSVYGLYPTKRYRRISFSEAKRLALHALFQAEAERIEIADREARSTYEWYEI